MAFLLAEKRNDALNEKCFLLSTFERRKMTGL